MTMRFCLILPANPTPREVARLRHVTGAMTEQIACVIGPDPQRLPDVGDLLGRYKIPLLHWPDAEKSDDAATALRFDATIVLAETSPADLQPLAVAKLGTWAFFEGDPRDSGATGVEQALADGRPRVAMTVKRLNESPNGGDLLAFIDVPRRPWDNATVLRSRLDSYLPQMIGEASERATKTSKVEIELGRLDKGKSARSFQPLVERFKDTKFHTHVLFNKMAPFFAKNKSVIILLHNPAPDVLDSTLTILRKIGPFIPYSRAVGDLIHGQPATPGFTLTFDDGYKENMALLDVLDRHECKAMFFLNTAIIDKDSALWFMNPDKDFLAKKPFLRSLDYASFLAAANEEGLTQPSALRGRFGLRSKDVRTLLARGQEIGVHTHNHPFLTRLTDDEIRKEVSECWSRLRSISEDQTLPLHFAYPDGDHDERVVAVLKDMGAESAVTIRPGSINSGTHRLKIPRYQLGDLDYPGLALLKLTRAYPAVQAIRR